MTKGHGHVVENDWRNLLYTELRRTGGDPSHLFEILEAIIRRRAWEDLVDEEGNPVGSLRRLIEAPLPVGCGQPVEKILKLLDIEHRYETASPEWRERMRKLRDDLRRELGAEPLAKHGTNQHADARTLHVRSSDEGSVYGNGSSYALRRLQRDAPELAKRVLAGELTANQAAIQAGFRHPTMTVYLTDMRKNARKLAHLLERDEILALIGFLNDELRAQDGEKQDAP